MKRGVQRFFQFFVSKARNYDIARFAFAHKKPNNKIDMKNIYERKMIEAWKLRAQYLKS